MRLHNLASKKNQRRALRSQLTPEDSEEAQEHDAIRSIVLERAGIRVVRFENHDVRENLEGVLAEIAEHFDRR